MPGGRDPAGPAQGESPRLGRLRKRPEFLAAAAGRRFHTERVTVQGRCRTVDDDAPDGLRFGLTVTKRVGHATERNRIRRRLRAAILEAGLPFATAPLDIVMVGRRDALSASFPQLIDDLARALPAVLRPKGTSVRGGRGTTSAAANPAADPTSGPSPGRPEPTRPLPRRDLKRSRPNPRAD